MKDAPSTTTTDGIAEPETHVIEVVRADGEERASENSLRIKNWLISQPALVVRPGDRVTFNARVRLDDVSNTVALMTFLNEADLPFEEGNPILINCERTLTVSGRAAPRKNVDFPYPYVFYLLQLDDLADGTLPKILVRDY